jgi:hypothetical protein
MPKFMGGSCAQFYTFSELSGTTRAQSKSDDGTSPTCAFGAQLNQSDNVESSIFKRPNHRQFHVAQSWFLIHAIPAFFLRKCSSKGALNSTKASAALAMLAEACALMTRTSFYL